MAGDQWIDWSQAVAMVRDRLGCSTGWAEAELGAAIETRRIRSRQSDDPVLLTHDDGIIGMSLRGGAMNKGAMSGDGWDINKGDLAYWLDRQIPPAAPRLSKPTKTARPTGRKRKFDATDVRDFVFGKMDHHGDFSPDDPEWDCKARLEDALQDQYEVSEPTARRYADEYYGEWKAQKAQN